MHVRMYVYMCKCVCVDLFHEEVYQPTLQTLSET